MNSVLLARHIDEILNYWHIAVDYKNGGIFYNMEPVLHRIEKTGRKAFLMHVRQLYNFSSGVDYKFDGAEDIAEHLYSSIDTVFSPKDGLYPFSVSVKRKNFSRMGDKNRWLYTYYTSYNQWYYITAVARYSRACNKLQALENAVSHLNHSREIYCAENFSSQGIAHKYNNGIADGKTGNDHLHYYEALIHLLSATDIMDNNKKRESLRSDLLHYMDETEALFAKKLLDTETFMTPDHLEDDCTFRKEGMTTTLGHPLEWFGFFVERSIITGEKRPVLKQYGRKLLDKTLEKALSDTGCFRSHYAFDSNTAYPKTDFWSQVEGILGALYGYYFFKDNVYLQKAELMWEFYRRFMTDNVNGGIYESVTEEGAVISSRKASVWKCDHHALRVCEKAIGYNLLGDAQGEPNA